MTEEEAQAWLRESLAVSRETWEKLDAFRGLLLAENEAQNLISRATVPHVWARHIVDSAQLITLAQSRGRGWLDLGSGPGLPGIVLAILSDDPVHLVEMRKGRVAFLETAASTLGLRHVQVHGCKVEALRIAPVDVITARAFAPLGKLFALAHRFSTAKTCWVLPKGKSARTELESVAGTWQGVFHVKHSLTDPDSDILVAEGVRKTGNA